MDVAQTSAARRLTPVPGQRRYGRQRHRRRWARGTASGTTVSSGGALFVLSGGIADPTTIYSGGLEIVSAGGTDDGAQISGGEQLDYGMVSGVTVFSRLAGRRKRRHGEQHDRLSGGTRARWRRHDDRHDLQRRRDPRDRFGNAAAARSSAAAS